MVRRNASDRYDPVLCLGDWGGEGEKCPGRQIFRRRNDRLVIFSNLPVLNIYANVSVRSRGKRVNYVNVRNVREYFYGRLFRVAKTLRNVSRRGCFFLYYVS